MLNSTTQEIIIEGTWDEIASHAEEVRHKKRLRLTVLPEESEAEEEAESRRLMKALEEALNEINPDEFIAPVEPLSPYGAAVVEKYRKQGWKI